MTKLSRQIRRSVKSGTSVPAVVKDIFSDRVTVKLSGNGALMHNLAVIGGPVSIGQTVHVDFTTPVPTVVAVTKALDIAQEFGAGAEPAPPIVLSDGGGGGDGTTPSSSADAIFVPAIGGNAGGYFGNDKDIRVYGGGPWFGGGGVEFHQAGLRIPWPAIGEEGASSDNYQFVAFGIVNLPSTMLGGFKVTPIMRLRKKASGGQAVPTLEIYTDIRDVNRLNGWELEVAVYGFSSGRVPYIGTGKLWSNTDHLLITFDPEAGSEGTSSSNPDYNAESTGYVYQPLTAGDPLMFSTQYWDDSGFNGFGWFIGWYLEAYVTA